MQPGGPELGRKQEVYVSVLTRNRADAELCQAGEREEVPEKDSNSLAWVLEGTRRRAGGHNGDSVFSGNGSPPREQGDLVKHS